jgi:ion channel POLLUX/CASTOR
MKRFYHRLKFGLEKLLFRGAHYQLVLIAVLIALVSLTAGLIVFLLTGAFPTFGSSIWWAFLRLSDPGYLGDDHGLVLQLVSTVVTILGYVLFMGALIAIMSQWLQRTMRRLESGFTPISINDHILILGWTNRTASIVRELVSSEGKVKRFLRRIGARRLRIVILAEEVTTALYVELRESLGRGRHDSIVTFRSGSPLLVDHLKRVDFVHAGVIILPGSDLSADTFQPSGGVDLLDTRTIKSLLTIANYHHTHPTERQPLIVAELADARRAPVVRTAYGSRIELIAGDQVISRLIAQNLRHPGLSEVYNELLTHSRGNAVYVREWPTLTGRTVPELIDAFPRAIVLGVVREHGAVLRPLLNPRDSVRLEEKDRIVFLARTWSDAEPATDGAPLPPQPRSTPVGNGEGAPRRVLFLGWNHKVPALVRELQSFGNGQFELDLLSLVPAREREAYLLRHATTTPVRHLEGDYTAVEDLRRIRPDGYDRIVFLANNWLGSHEESDARTILGYLVLRGLLAEGSGAGGAEPDGLLLAAPDRAPENAGGGPRDGGPPDNGPPDGGRPAILVELMNPDNEELLPGEDREVLITSEIISHMVAHIALRRELRVVFDELFSAGGPEISFRAAGQYGIGTVGTGRARTSGDGSVALATREVDGGDGSVALAARDAGAGLTFQRAAEIVAAHGDILLGYRLTAAGVAPAVPPTARAATRAKRTVDAGGTPGVVLNPPRETEFPFDATTRLVVLTTYGEPDSPR